MNIAGQEGSLNNNRRWCVVAMMIFRSGSDGMYCQRVTRRFPPTNLLIGIKLLLSYYCAGRQVLATNSHHYSSVTRAARQYLAAIISRLHCHDLPQFWCHARIGWVLCKVKTFNRYTWIFPPFIAKMRAGLKVCKSREPRTGLKHVIILSCVICNDNQEASKEITSFT